MAVFWYAVWIKIDLLEELAASVINTRTMETVSTSGMLRRVVW
jgi:hypothetical protein